MASALRDKCAIVGIGETAYTRGTDKSSTRLHLEAALTAIHDAGLTPTDIDGYLPYSGAGVIVEQFIANLGLTDVKHSAEIHQGGASLISQISNVAPAIATGVCNYALITMGRAGFSGEDQRVSTQWERSSPKPQLQYLREFESPYGIFAPPQFYAASMRRHMYDYGTTSRQFGALAVAMRKHAQLNPRAIMYGKPMTIEDYEKSRLIVDPMRLLDCSLETDGAGAIVITSVERARDLKQKPIYIMGVAQGHPDLPFAETMKPVMTEIPGVRKAAKRAFTMAGVVPEDIDVAMIYDAFTWICLCSIEDIGFCKKGEGGPFVEAGRVELGGQLPINTHGGLLSEAHVSGIGHMNEAVRQLRGVLGNRQVEDAEIALVSAVGDFGNGSVVILRR